MASFSCVDARSLLAGAYHTAVAAAKASNILRSQVPSRPEGRTIVVGAGKACAEMAAALENCWEGSLEGVVVVPYGAKRSLSHIEVIEASHPVPDAAGLDASRRLLRAVSNLSSADLVIALMSGGGSALLPMPPVGVTLEEEAEANRILLAAGLPIDDMNIVRKHISMIKGGRLAAAAWPARTVSLVLSDIPGDEPAHVASGPTIPDVSTRHDALRVVRMNALRLPLSIIAHLESPEAIAPSPSDARFHVNEVRLIGSAAISLDAAAAFFRERGFVAVILSDSVQGEARDVGTAFAAVAREVASRDRPFPKPVVLLSGGEATVTVRTPGRGGRNAEFMAGLALGIAGFPKIEALAADTDGIDGTESNAGAFADGSSVERMLMAGIDLKAALRANDTWRAFDAVDDLFNTGPTGTNVNDFRAILIR